MMWSRLCGFDDRLMFVVSASGSDQGSGELERESEMGCSVPGSSCKKWKGFWNTHQITHSQFLVSGVTWVSAQT